MFDLRSDRTAPEFVIYQETLRDVLAVKGAAVDGGGDPSEYWQEELAGFDYMLDASPLLIRKLRHHCYHVTGLRVYDYRTGKSPAALAERRRALLEVGDPALLVPESRALGGFGHELDGELYNVDTLKYYEVLVGLDRSGALAPFRAGGERRAVWEIGAGWGGFPYQFKTLFPDSTYIISDLPELFLFSAVYLRSQFPGARAVFATDREVLADALARWRELDFIFVPNTLTDAIAGLTPDLTVNTVSFQEMTSEQVASYVHRAADLGCPHLYSLNRDQSVYNEEISNVRELIRERYRLQECSVLDVDYAAGAKGKAAARRRGGYQHVLGTLRPTRDSAPSRPLQPRALLAWVGAGGASGVRVLDGVLRQSEGDFILLVPRVESCTPDWGEVLADPRVEVVEVDRASEVHLRTAMLAEVVRRWPRVPYFGWVDESRDLDEGWLEVLLEELDSHPEAVLAYPALEGGRCAVKPFDTAGYSDRRDRFGRVCNKLDHARQRAAGVYRLSAIARLGGPREIADWSHLLLLELALEGEFREVAAARWDEARQTAGEMVGAPRGVDPGAIAGAFLRAHGRRRSPLGIGRLAALRLAATIYRTQRQRRLAIVTR